MYRIDGQTDRQILIILARMMCKCRRIQVIFNPENAFCAVCSVFVMMEVHCVTNNKMTNESEREREEEVERERECPDSCNILDCFEIEMSFVSVCPFVQGRCERKDANRVC